MGKKSSVKSLFLAAMLLLCSNTAFAAVVSGVVMDKTDDAPIANAIVRLLKSSNNKVVGGGVTNENGSFNIKEVAAGEYTLTVSFIGYTDYNKTIKVNKNINVGNIALEFSAIMLEETTVIAAVAPIKVMEDTVEYNTSSYTTPPNAVVEDLLKRLPGVEVSSDGSITAQGKEITKILVDGKEFFSDDPKVASKNIPIEMIDKLQVVDKKSDLAILTGVDDGDDETVINLTIKKGMNNGWFGNVSAGYGTDDRYQAKGIANWFSNGNQVSILAGGNNINELGFTDAGAQNFKRYGGTNGINNSQNLGVTLNVGTQDESFRVGGDVMYSRSDQQTDEIIAREYLFTDSTSYYDSETYSRDKGNNIRANFRIKWEVDSLNTLEFRPKFTASFNDSEQDDFSATYAGDSNRSIVNESTNSDTSDGTSYEIKGELIYSRKFRNKPGRVFSAQFEYEMSDIKEDGLSYSTNKYYLLDTDEIINQRSDEHTWSNSYRGRVSWVEPIGSISKARFFTTSYMIKYKSSNADKLVYDLTEVDTSSSTSSVLSSTESSALYSTNKSVALLNSLSKATSDEELDAITEAMTETEWEETYDSDLSNCFRNEFLDQTLQFGYKQMRTAYNLDAGISINPSMSRSIDLIDSDCNIDDRWTWNIAPYLRYRYKFSKRSTLQMFYRARTSEPSMTQLQPVVDTSNPLYIVEGNPELKPTFSNNFNLRLNDYNEDKQRSIMLMASAQISTNSIVNNVSYDDTTGGQYVTYENANGVWNASLVNMISMPLSSNPRWQFSHNLFSRYSTAVSYVDSELNKSGTISATETIGMAFRTDVAEIELKPTYTIQATNYNINVDNNSTIHTYGASLNGTYYTPFGVVLNSDVSYSNSAGYSDGFDSSQWLWNASISYQFLKNKAGTVALKAYDILQDKKNISRTVTGTYIQDSQYNTLTRYIMASFTYTFKTFGGSTPELQRMDRRGPPPM